MYVYTFVFKQQVFGQRPTSKLIVNPFSRRSQPLQGVAVGERGEVLLVLVFSLRQQLLALHEGRVELFVRVCEDHLVVELRHHGLTGREQNTPGRVGIKGDSGSGKREQSIAAMRAISVRLHGVILGIKCGHNRCRRSSKLQYLLATDRSQPTALSTFQQGTHRGKKP